MKTRVDSWAAALTEEQEWALFYKARRCQWQDAVAWAAAEFNLPRKPSRTGFYAWLKSLAEHEHEHDIRQALLAQAHARELAKGYQVSDDTSVKALMACATDAALVTKDAHLAKELVSMALSIRDRLQRERDLALKERAQETKSAELALAREKFEAAEKRLAAATDTVADEKLTDAERVARIKTIFGLK